MRILFIKLSVLLIIFYAVHFFYFYNIDAIAISSKESIAQKKEFLQMYSGGQWKNGEQIYHALCAQCHLVSIGIGPVLLGRHYSPIALMSIVRHGINTMPTFRPSEINDAELLSLAQWIEQAPASLSLNNVNLFGVIK